jgi:hypothetical protein
MKTALFFLFVLTQCIAQTESTQVRIRIINAMNGHPIKHRLLSVGFGARALEKESDKSGLIEVTADLGGTISLATQPYAECRAKNQSEAMATKYFVSDIDSSGVSSQNICGKAKMKAKPGELIIFERPRPFWAFLAAPIAY